MAKTTTSESTSSQQKKAPKKPIRKAKSAKESVKKLQAPKAKKASQKKDKKAKYDGLKIGFTRSEKTDFTALYTAHRAEMNANGCNVDAMIKLRR